MKDPKDKISSDIRIIVNAQLTIYGTFASVYIPDVPIISQVPGYEKPLKAGLPESNEPYETNEERSLRRTRRNIRGIVDCNDFDLFVTFTFNREKVDRYDIDACKKVLATWLKNQRSKHGSFSYILVMEYHKDGAAHFHGLFGNYKGKVVESINPKTGKHHKDERGRLSYAFPEFNSGYSVVKYVEEKRDSKSKVALYIQKYITKDMPLIFGKNRYWTSHGLKRPTVIDNPEPWYEHVTPDNEIRTDYGRILYFDIKKIGIFLP